MWGEDDMQIISIKALSHDVLQWLVYVLDCIIRMQDLDVANSLALDDSFTIYRENTVSSLETEVTVAKYGKPFLVLVVDNKSLSPSSLPHLTGRGVMWICVTASFSTKFSGPSFLLAVRLWAIPFALYSCFRSFIKMSAFIYTYSPNATDYLIIQCHPEVPLHSDAVLTVHPSPCSGPQ